jgi:hypothetical protein
MYLFLFALEDELSQLELKIEELKLAARELKDRRNVRLFLPHEPLWPLAKRQENELDPNSSFMTLEDASILGLSLQEAIFLIVYFSRCSISTRFRVYVYPREQFANNHIHSLYDQFIASPYRVEDPSNACLFVGVLESDENDPGKQFKGNNVILEWFN